MFNASAGLSFLSATPMINTKDGPPPPAQFTWLTPDAVMQYCTARLQGIDTQVEAAFAKQSSDNADSSALSALAGSAALAAPSQPPLKLSEEAGFQKTWDAYHAFTLAADQVTDPDTRKALQNAAAALADKLNSALGDLNTGLTVDKLGSDGDIQNLFCQNGSSGLVTSDGVTHAASGSTSQTMEASDWDSLVNTQVKNIQTDLNSSSELSMIGLQSLMSQRQEAIQISTNLVQSLGDQQNKIAENVGK